MMLVSFLLSLAMFPAVVLLPSLCIVESKGVGSLQSWDIAAEGWETWPVLLLCFGHQLQSPYPQLYCIPACVVAPIRISLGFSSPLLQLPCTVSSDSEGNLLTAVSHPPGCIFLLQKIGGFVICLLHLPLPIQIPSFLCDKENTVTIIVSPQEGMKEKVWTKAGPP